MDEVVGPAAARPRVGFHISAFGSHQMLAALSALSRCGFEGIEVYGDITHIFAQPAEVDEFRAILDIMGLDLAGVHSGGLLTSAEYRPAEVLEWRRMIDWTAAAGGEYAIYYGGESHGSPAEDLDRAASFLNEIGRFAADRGVRLCYEPDRSCPFTSRERVGALMAATEPGLVWLSADTAHLVAMGVDPALFLLSQKARLEVVHFRDRRAQVDLMNPERTNAELGQGGVDFSAVVETLRLTGFDGWIVGAVPKPLRNPFESAQTAALHMRDTLGLDF